jgi:hypothetical protein
MAAMEQQQIRLLSMLFHISHAILFVEQACRFDLDCITTLKQLNKLRLNNDHFILKNSSKT